MFSLVLAVTAFTAWLLIANGQHGLEAAAYKFAVVIIGGLATKAVLAASVRVFTYDVPDGDVCHRSLRRWRWLFTDASVFRRFGGLSKCLLMPAGSIDQCVDGQ